MKINLAKSMGFCFGVRRAIDIALKAAASEKNVYMLGDIVHNEDVARQMYRAGIKKVKKLTGGKNKIFIIRAHGIDKASYQKAERLGYKVIDATCPMVKEIHRIARTTEDPSCQIIVIGDKRHDEVKGIVGQLKGKAIIIDNPKNINLREIKELKKACVVVQSTQIIENVFRIISILRKYIKDLKFFNTVCRPTRIKQQEIKTLPLENDVVIVIGSKNSANTKRLYEISKSLNKRSYWINATKDIKKVWFRQAKSVGITSGASTPDSATESIIKYIEKLK